LVVKGEDFGKTGISAAWVRAGVLSLGLPKEATPGSEGKISDGKLETEGLPPLGEHVVTGEGAKKWRINAMRSLRERAPDSHDRGACAQANLN